MAEGIEHTGCSGIVIEDGIMWKGADFTTERYLDLLKNAKVKGYLFEQQNYYSKEGQQQ